MRRRYGPIAVIAAMVIAACVTAVQLSETEQAMVVVSGDNTVFNGAGTLAFTISAQTATDDDILLDISGSGCGTDWSLNDTIDVQGPPPGPHICGASAPQLGPSGSGACPLTSYTFDVSFNPTNGGTQTCDYVISTMTASGSANPPVTLHLSGNGAMYLMSVTPGVSFGDVPVNTTSMPAQTVTVANVGASAFTLSGGVGGADPTAFQVVPNAPATFSPHTLGAGSSETYSVQCKPTAVQPYSASIDFLGSPGPGTQSTTLTCNGINSNLTITPSQVTFARTPVGRPPPDQAVTVTETANPTDLLDIVQLDSTALAAGVAFVGSSHQGQSVGSGQTITLSYSAATAQQGALGTLQIKAHSDAMTRNVAISGETDNSGIATNPPSIEFGPVCVGGTGSASIEVYANMAADVQLQAPTPPAAPFSVATTGFPQTLHGNHTGQSGAVMAFAQPTAVGSAAGMLALNTDIPSQMTWNIGMSVTGLAPGIALTPGATHFGTIHSITTTTPAQAVVFTNCSSAPITVSAAAITGADASSFAIVSPTDPTATLVPPGTGSGSSTETFLVVMSPRSAGPKSAQLAVTHSQGVTTADLDGSANVPTDRQTYYACSTASPHGVALVVIAIAFALRRRRR